MRKSRRLRTPSPAIGWIAAAALAPSGCAPDAPAAPRAEPLPVAITTVQPERSYPVRRHFTGLVRSRRASGLGFERGGLVTRVRVEEGDVVAAGQPIADLDTAQLTARRRELEAQLRAVEARVELSRITSRRIGELADAEYTSRQAQDEASFGLRAREAEADRLRAAIAAVDVELRKSHLRAPFGGTIARRLVDEGEVVAPGAAAFRYLDTSAAEATVGVPTDLAGTLRVGSTHALQVAGRAYDAELSAVTDDVDPVTRTRAVVFLLPADARVTDGQIVELELVREVPAGGFWLPVDAITEGLRGMWTAYSIDAEGRVRREALEILHADGDRVFVRGTLEAGERVVASGLHRLVPGRAVAVADEVAP